MSSILKNSDVRAITLLVLLWALFFWRLLTPIATDQASFKQGDFSGQFVAFGAYQYERFADGEIPLWNPYNNGGLPFIADTQAAVFYPPRLLTIALSVVAGGWSYHALELEAIFHVLALSFLMYAFVRRLTVKQPGSVLGAFVAAIVVAYGGFTSGYPPLQLALLEAGIWLPLSALGVLEATRQKSLAWRWLVLAGFALGLSWMAGHPQTSFFATYLLVAWLAYRVYVQRMGWLRLILGTALMGVVTLGITAVTFLPGLEYLMRTARADLGFAAKGNGFPFQDLAQFILPGSVSLFSPLYIGLPALILIYIAVRDRLPNSIFWIGAAGIGLIHSFGANTALYHALYNVVPGLRFFRGQERAAFIVAFSLAILAGLGAAHIASWRNSQNRPDVAGLMRGLLALMSIITLGLLLGWLGNVGENFGQHIGTAVFSTLILSLTYIILRAQIHAPRTGLMIVLAGVIVFELFSVNLDADSNYDDIPPAQQLAITPPPIVQTALDAAPQQPFRVDGFRGLQDNYGSMYRVMDMRGISPLFLSTAREIIYRDYINNPLAWELFAVRYVFSERERFSNETTIIAEGSDREGRIFLHELRDPRPFAQLIYQADVVDSDAFALALLDDARYNPRESIIILGDPNIELPQHAPDDATATVTSFAPESITIAINTSENGILSLAHVDYPGWRATLNGETVPILRAYGALSAVAVPAGEHTIQLRYDPLSYEIGATLSLATWWGVVILSLLTALQAVLLKQQG